MRKMLSVTVLGLALLGFSGIASAGCSGHSHGQTADQSKPATTSQAPSSSVGTQTATTQD